MRDTNTEKKLQPGREQHTCTLCVCVCVCVCYLCVCVDGCCLLFLSQLSQFVCWSSVLTQWNVVGLDLCSSFTCRILDDVTKLQIHVFISAWEQSLCSEATSCSCLSVLQLKVIYYIHRYSAERSKKQYRNKNIIKSTKSDFKNKCNTHSILLFFHFKCV